MHICTERSKSELCTQTLSSQIGLCEVPQYEQQKEESLRVRQSRRSSLLSHLTPLCRPLTGWRSCVNNGKHGARFGKGVASPVSRQWFAWKVMAVCTSATSLYKY